MDEGNEASRHQGIEQIAANIDPPAWNNIPEIKPGLNTSEFLATAGISGFGGLFFVVILIVQFVSDNAKDIPSGVSIAALIVAGVITAWPVVLYSTNRRRLKSDEIAACAKLAAGEIEAKARRDAAQASRHRGIEASSSSSTGLQPVNNNRPQARHANGIANSSSGGTGQTTESPKGIGQPPS